MRILRRIIPTAFNCVSNMAIKAQVDRSSSDTHICKKLLSAPENY